MGTFAKVLVTLVIALPMAAYVAGSLMASSADPPERREPVIVLDRDTSRPVTPTPGRGGPDPDGDDRVVDPQPTRVDDDDDDGDDQGDNDDDGDGVGDGVGEGEDDDDPGGDDDGSDDG